MVRDYAKKCPLGHWSFLGLGEEEKWYGTQKYKPEGQWNSTADVMVSNFEDSGHPVFRASSALDRGFLKKKGGQCTIHFSGDPSHAEILFRTINSANQLSIYRAIADWCDDSADSWSILFKHGGIHCESGWAVISKMRA